MVYARSTLLRRMAFGTRGKSWLSFFARGNALSFVARARRPNLPEPSESFCDTCAADTQHESFDDVGYGWYAQMWRCRRCGHESVRVWPVSF
jgi:hypothetical protein